MQEKTFFYNEEKIKKKFLPIDFFSGILFSHSKKKNPAFMHS